MKMTLGYRIAQFPIQFPNRIPRDDVEVNSANLQRDLVREGRVVAVDATNVAEYYASYDQDAWRIKDFPNIVVPFDRYLIEYQEPDYYTVGGRRISSTYRDGTQMGVIGEMRDLNIEGVRGQVETTLSTEFPGVNNKLASARFVNHFFWWMSSGVKPILGRPYYPGVSCLLLAEESGKYIHQYVRLFGVDLEDKILQANLGGVFQSVIHVLCMTASFMHCKNVSIDDKTSERSPAKHSVGKSDGHTRLTYKVLNINPLKTPSDKTGGREGSTAKKSLHICRGHFATYKEDAPLFGKYTGTFWHPQHIRGSQSVGTVVKEYLVEGVS